jgi:hypothetical protein
VASFAWADLDVATRQADEIRDLSWKVGESMRKLSGMLLAAGLAALPTGCTKSQPQGKSVPHVKTADTSNSVEHTLELHARRAKREIDQITDEAEDAVRKAEDRLHSEAGKREEEMSEFAAEVAEEAKDRAVDIPEVVDRVLERHTKRLHDSLRKARQHEETDEEAAPEE